LDWDYAYDVYQFEVRKQQVGETTYVCFYLEDVTEDTVLYDDYIILQYPVEGIYHLASTLEYYYSGYNGHGPVWVGGVYSYDGEHWYLHELYDVCTDIDYDEDDHIYFEGYQWVDGGHKVWYMYVP
jgi:hypothetical protein